jgi:hypothetical protein
VLVTLPAPNIAVPVHHSCAKTGDCDDNPDHEHRGDHALIAVLGDYGYQPGDPGTDPGTQQQGLVPTWREGLSNWAATLRASAKLGFDPLINLCANPIDQALSYSIVIGVAQFAMRRRGSGNVITGCLVHALTIHLDRMPDPRWDECRRNAAADLAPPVATRPLVPHDPATPPARWLPYSGTGCGPRPVVRGRVWPPARREDHANSAYIRPARRLVIEATVNL